MLGEFIDLGGVKDDRGLLVAAESHRNIPFEIKRVYYLTEVTSDAPRGFHAHRNLTQVAVCLKGSCKFIIDNGKERKEVLVNDPTRGLLIGSMVWREMHEFTADCVLMVIASELYDESDYIRDYNQFIEEVNQTSTIS